MRLDARPTPRERRAALLELANPVKRGLRRRLPTRSIRSRWIGIFPRGRRRRVPRGPRRRRAVRCQLASHVRGRSQVRHGRTGENVGRSGRKYVWIEDARVGVIVCAWKVNSLVGGARLRAADADLGARWIELGSAEGLGQVERDDFVPDQVVPWSHLRRKRHRDGCAVHCVSSLISCVAGRKR